MLVLDRQSGATAQLQEAVSGAGARAGRIQLRLRADGQLFELLPGKTTIGSSPRCNVRIEKAGVQPLHCLIVDGQHGLRVRSWVANTTLNGLPVEESALAVGDCLSLGPVELEVIDPQAMAPQPTAAQKPAVESKDVEAVRSGREHARARGRQLLNTLRQERTNYRELCRQVARLQESHLDVIAEQSEIGGKLEISLAELAEARQQLAGLQSVETARQQLAERNEELGFEIGKLSAQINELTAGHAEASSLRVKLEQENAALQSQHQHSLDANLQLAERNEQLGFEIGGLSAQINELTTGHAEGSSDRVALEQENAWLQVQHEQAVEANQQLREEVAGIASDKAAADRQIQQLAARNEQLGFEIGELSAQINELASGHRDVTSDQQQLADEHAQLQLQHQQLAEANSRLKNDVVQLANEKAGADENNQQLSAQKSRLQKQVDHLTEQKAQLEDERAGLRRQNEQLLSEARECGVERGSLAEERTALFHERSELRHENEKLLARVAELDNENSAMAVSRLTLEETHDTLGHEVKQLRTQLADLNEENAALAAAKVTLADEKSRLVAERDRLVEVEREMGAAVAGRDNASAELYRALLRLAEMEERDSQNKAIVEAYESLSTEHDKLHEHADHLKEQIELLSEERAGVEMAWQGLSDEAAALGESQQRLAQENAELAAKLDETQELLEKVQQDQATSPDYSAELEQERAARLQAQAEIASAIAEGERRLAEQESHFAEQARQFAEQSGQFNALTQQHAEQVREYAESIRSLELELAEASEKHDSLARVGEESQLQLADAASYRAEHVRRIQELEAQLAAVEERALHAAESATNSLAKHEIERASLLTGTEPAGEAAVDQNTWDRPHSIGEAWNAPAQKAVESDEPAERVSNAWLTTSCAVDANRFSDEKDGTAAEEPTEEAAESKPAHQPPSFIDRYSHMFSEESGASDANPTRPSEPQQPKPVMATGTGIQSAKAERSASSSEDEDSIEQYMAKLLQRVRGDSPASPVSDNQPEAKAPSAPATRQPAIAPPAASELEAAPAVSEADQVDAQVVASGELIRRRVSTPIPTTNLGALRALANETARLAIGRHELRKMRRNARTKTIVATLAGMTSLWLMLDSTSWRSLQFITACGTLLVAAYWAGEAFRALLSSNRITANEGPEETALPIDVEGGENDSDAVAN